MLKPIEQNGTGAKDIIPFGTQTPPGSARYLYKIELVPTPMYTDERVAKLNKLGAEGWRVAALEGPHYVLLEKSLNNGCSCKH
jgi:hypothetical protein